MLKFSWLEEGQGAYTPTALIFITERISVWFLSQSSYDELKAFPTTAVLDEKQANHMMNFKSRRDEKTYTLDELMVC